MVAFKITVTGVQKFVSKLNKFAKKETFDDILYEIANKAEQYAQNIAPYDTGLMANSIRAIKTGDLKYALQCVAENKNGYNYAIANEYGAHPWGRLDINVPIGTADSPRFYGTGYRPFLRPALYKALQDAPKGVSKKLREIGL